MSLLSPQLEAFLSIAECKTVHGAAKTLGITQTGVTQRIRTLEASLTTTLFTRSRRGMLLTAEGEALLRYCQASRDLEGEVLAKIQGAGERATVHVCITGPTSIMRSRIVPQCKSAMKAFPELLLHFNITDVETWVDHLRTGVAQLAVLPHELVGRELDSKVLKPERYVLMGPRVWRRRSLLDIIKNERIIDFDPTDNMSFDYLKKFKLMGHARTDRHFVNSNESVAEMIESEIGYGVFTFEFAEKFLKRCNVTLLNEGKVLEYPMALAWYPRPSSPAYWSSLISQMH
jgi:LysR family transcriptional regulator (chromosome initiation inhibitor)